MVSKYISDIRDLRKWLKLFLGNVYIFIIYLLCRNNINIFIIVNDLLNGFVYINFIVLNIFSLLFFLNYF